MKPLFCVNGNPLLPPEIENLILREKHTMESEDTRDIFKEVLLELLEYSFACKSDNRRSYEDLCIDRREEKEFNYSILGDSILTCEVCKESIEEAYYPESWGFSDTIYTYHTLKGGYNCCYFLHGPLDNIIMGKTEIPETLPVHAGCYHYDSFDMSSEYIRDKVSNLDMGFMDTSKVLDVLRKLDTVECKYTFSKRKELLVNAAQPHLPEV